MAVLNVLLKTGETNRPVARGRRANDLNEVGHSFWILVKVAPIPSETFGHVRCSPAIVLRIARRLDVNVLDARLR